MSREQMLSVIHVKQPRQWYESPFSIGLINSCTYKQQNMRLIAVGLSGPVPLCLPPPPSKLNWFRFRKVNTCAFFFFLFWWFSVCLLACLYLFIYLFQQKILKYASFSPLSVKSCVYTLLSKTCHLSTGPRGSIYMQGIMKNVSLSVLLSVST